MKTMLFKKRIIPNKFFYEGKVFRITEISSKYIITECKIEVTNNNAIKRVIINAKHPNSNPENNEFCLPKRLKGEELNKLTLVLIEDMLSSFHLDDCYFLPLEELRWVKL